MDIAGKSVLAVPPVVLLAPLNVTVLDPPLRVPPLFVQFPVAVTLPPRVTVTPEFNWTLPKLTAVVGVTVEFAVKIALVPALRMSPPVADTVRFSPKFNVAPETVVKIGVADPPEAKEKAPLKDILPAPVKVRVPSF